MFKKSFKVIPFIAALLGGATLFAPAAFAGTSGVTNSTSIRRIYNGTYNADIYINEDVVRNQYSTLQSIKVETYGGDTNISVATYKDGKLSGRAISTNNTVVDPVAIITTNKVEESLQSYKTVQVYANESYEFTGYERSHSVETYTN